MLTESEQIEEIRKVYPRRVAPVAARKMIVRATLRLVQEKRFADEHTARRFLFKKAKEFSLSPAGRPVEKGQPDYRPYPATWFNAGHYDTDPAEWQKPNGGRNGKYTTADSETIARANAKIAELGGNPLRTR
jgi:hypothetical protein